MSRGGACRVAQWQQDKQRQPRQILGALLENAVAPQAVTIVGGRLPAQRLFLKTTLSRRGASPQLDVTIWTHTLASQPMLSMLSTWTSVIAQSSRYHMEEREHPLRLALVRMLRANPELARMERELAAAPGGFALGTLLQKFEAAKDLPEAPQPAGFTAGIKLHDYQRCVLCARVLHVLAWRASAACMALLTFARRRAGRACNGCSARSARRCATSSGCPSATTCAPALR